MSLDVALAGGDLTTYTTTAYQGAWHLSLFPMTTFATAQVNQAVFTTPLAQLTVDTTSADWLNVRKNMIAWVGTSAGTHDIGIYRVRETPGATTLYIMETSPGDPGLVAKRVTKLFVDNAYITIIDAPNIWSVFPRIAYSGGAGTFYKDYDEAYTDQNSSTGAVPGILRLEDHTIVKVADGATHTEERTASETLFASAVASRQWTPPAGASLVSGLATAATVEYQYPVGNHLIKYSETLANTAVMSGQRCVIVHDDSTNPALEISEPSWDEGLDGVRCSVNLISAFDTDILAGAMVFLWQEMDSTSIASQCNYMVGFVEQINGNIDPGLGVASLDIVSPLAVMSRVKGFSQELTYAAAPANWQETNIAYYDFWAWYVLHYHTTILNYFDFFPSGRTTRTASGWRSGAGSWLEAINGAVDADNAQLTADPHGSLYLKRDPFLMTTAERASLITRLELTAILVSSVRYSRRIRPSVHKVEAYGFSVGTGTPTAYRSQAIGNTGGQGIEGQRLTDQRVSDQAELNARNGNAYAKENNPYDAITVTLVSGYHVIHPALRYLVNLTLTDATLLPEGSTEPLDFDCVPERVSISWETDNFGNATPLITLTLIPLTDGNATPGETMPLDARVGAELTIPTMDALTGLPDLEFEPLGYPDYFGLPPITGIAPIAVPTGTPGATTPETTEVVIHGADAGGKAHYTSDWTAGAGSPTWTLRASPATIIQHILPALNSRQAMYALLPGALWYSANVATTNFTDLSLAGFTAGYLMRMTSAGHLVLIGTDGADTAVQVYNGASLSAAVMIDTWQSEANGDVDDFGLGLVVVPSNFQLWFATSYSGAFAQMTGLTGVTGSSPAHITMTRIPYKRVSGALNNNLAAMEVIYSIYRASLHRVTYNFLTNSVVSTTAITPTIGGLAAGCLSRPDSAGSVVSNGTNFEVYGGNARYMIGNFRNNSGIAAVLKSADGGATWSDWGVPLLTVAHQVHFVEPTRGGDGLKCWAITESGIFHTDDFWSTYDAIADPGYSAPNLSRGIFQL